MQNPGTYTLFTGAITTALTAAAQTAITSLDGMLAVTFEAEVVGWTGGSSIQGLIQTSLDGGTTWLDVANFYFTGAGKKFATMSGTAETPSGSAVSTYSALTSSSDGKNVGLIGPQYRGVVTTVGTFSNTTLAMRLVAR